MTFPDFICHSPAFLVIPRLFFVIPRLDRGIFYITFTKIDFYSEGEPATNEPSHVPPIDVELVREGSR